MKLYTRIISLALALVMLLGIVPLAVFAQDEAIESTAAGATDPVLDALAAKATGELYGNIAGKQNEPFDVIVPSDAVSMYEQPCASYLGSGTNIDVIYVDSSDGDGSKVLIDSVNEIGPADATSGGSARTNYTFTIVSSLTVTDRKYYVASFNIKRGEMSYGQLARIRADGKYKVTTTVTNAAGEVISTVTTDEAAGSNGRIYDGNIFGYNNSTGTFEIDSSFSDTGSAVSCGNLNTAMYTNFTVVYDFENCTVYTLINGVLYATKTNARKTVTTTYDEATGNTTTVEKVPVFTSIRFNPWFGQSYPYAGIWAQYGRTVAFTTDKESDVFETVNDEKTFKYASKNPANGVFKIKGDYYFFQNGIALADTVVDYEGYKLVLEKDTGKILNYYVEAPAAESSSILQNTISGSVTFVKADGKSEKSFKTDAEITAYRYKTNDAGEEVVESYTFAVGDFTKSSNEFFTVNKFLRAADVGTVYLSEADLKADNGATLKKDPDLTYGTGSSNRNDSVTSFDVQFHEGIASTSKNFNIFRMRFRYSNDTKYGDNNIISVSQGHLIINKVDCGPVSTTEITHFDVVTDWNFDDLSNQICTTKFYVNGQYMTTYSVTLKDAAGKCFYNIGIYFSSGFYCTDKIFTLYPMTNTTLAGDKDAFSTTAFAGYQDGYYANDKGSYYAVKDGKLEAIIKDAESASNATDLPFVSISDYSVSLTDKIHLNYYLNLNAAALAEGNYATVTVNGVETKIDLNTLTKKDGKYVLTAKLSSIQLAEDVIVRFYTKDGDALTINCGGKIYERYAYSVKQYVAYIVENSNNFSAEALSAAKALLVYGAYAERNFIEGKQDLSTASVVSTYERLEVKYADIGVLYDISKVNQSSPYQFTYSVKKSSNLNLSCIANDFSKLGAAYLVLNDSIKIRVELNVNEAPTDLVGADLLTKTEDGKTSYYAEIRDLKITDLNNVYTFSFGGTEVSLSALALANVVESDTTGLYDDNFKNLMRAMYAYYYYATEYAKTV